VRHAPLGLGKTRALLREVKDGEVPIGAMNNEFDNVAGLDRALEGINADGLDRLAHAQAAPLSLLELRPTTEPAPGEKINPHCYVPHDRKLDKNIPACTNCHKPHPNPITSKKEVIKPNVDWCYKCHHNNDFQPCGACHK